MLQENVLQFSASASDNMCHADADFYESLMSKVCGRFSSLISVLDHAENTVEYTALNVI